MSHTTLDQLATAWRLMVDFAERTGLVAEKRVPRRYLWTDAFAVCNLLGIFVRTRDQAPHRLALALVDQVHRVLGHHRPDDERSGWISGLDESAGEAHPTIGGLRIGKQLPERRPGEARDDVLEWERDGQYFHYLTKWMRALDRVARVGGSEKAHLWSVELARAAFARFSYPVDGTRARRMWWKMSIDLTRPLVESMGHHDPLDGFVTACELHAHADDPRLRLDVEIEGYARMCRGVSWVTDDLLGIGGLLVDAHALAELAIAGSCPQPALLEVLLGAALQGLGVARPDRLVVGHPEQRLAFRELGLSIGLHAVARMRTLIERFPNAFVQHDRVESALHQLAAYEKPATEIEDTWLQPASRRSRTWLEHQDINEVMLATSLAPDGFLALDCGPVEETQ